MHEEDMLTALIMYQAMLLQCIQWNYGLYRQLVIVINLNLEYYYWGLF